MSYPISSYNKLTGLGSTPYQFHSRRGGGGWGEVRFGLRRTQDNDKQTRTREHVGSVAGSSHNPILRTASGVFPLETRVFDRRNYRDIGIRIGRSHNLHIHEALNNFPQTVKPDHKQDLSEKTKGRL